MFFNQKKPINNFNIFYIFTIILSVFTFSNIAKQIPAEAGLEFQWNSNDGYKKLKWYQKDGQKKAKNKIFFFLRPSERKTGLLKINFKVPDNFKSTIKENKISLCKVQIGGIDKRTKCLEPVPSDVELNEDKTRFDIYPYNPIPSSKDSYAVVLKVNNPHRSGLYQFHSFGQSSGRVPVSSYLGSWTIKIDQM